MSEEKKKPKFTEKNPPFNADGSPKKRFEVRRYPDSKGGFKQDVFIDGELFDFEIDKESIRKAAAMGPEYLEAVKKDLQNYFCECISEVVGREINTVDVMRAHQQGWI